MGLDQFQMEWKPAIKPSVWCPTPWCRHVESEPIATRLVSLDLSFKSPDPSESYTNFITCAEFGCPGCGRRWRGLANKGNPVPGAEVIEYVHPDDQL